MDNRQHLGRVFRDLISGPDYLFGFGVGNANEAKLAAKAGAKAVYNGGYTDAMYAGVTDTGIRNMVEVSQTTSEIVKATYLPVIADIDDGYGNAINAIRTASEFFGREFLDPETWEVRRIAGVHIEDQKFPKRCGHIAGKDVVSEKEFELKMKAVCRVRDAFDKEAVVIARTDVYHSQKPESLDEAVSRIARAASVGADLGWMEDNNASRETAAELAERLHKLVPGFPLAFNYSPSLKWYLESNPMTFDELNDYGYKFIFITIAAGHAASYAVYEYMKEIGEKGAEALWSMQRKKIGHPTESHHEMAGVPLTQALERMYIPGADIRQQTGEGFGADKAGKH